jgi:photosystem II stability/assembly factor-like uncharacterized protein
LRDLKLRTRLLIGPGLIGVCLVVVLGGCRLASDWHWEHAEAGLPRQSVVLALAVDPANPERLWAGYYAPGGLASSQDGGQSWTFGARGLGDNPVFDLLARRKGRLWAATRDGLLESQDGGSTWQSVTTDLPSATAFALAADDAGRLYVGLDDAGLYRGQPNGQGWTQLGTQGSQPSDEGLSTAAVLSVAVSTDGTQLYAGTSAQGVFASQDGGRTWQTAFGGDYVPNLALDPAHPANAIASLRTRLVRTQDGGQSWQVVPVPWAGQEVVSLLWTGPDGSAQNDPVTRLAGTLWAGSGQGEVFCSQDSGATWLELAAPPTEGGVLELALASGRSPDSPPRLLAGTWTGIYATPARCQAGDQPGWSYLSPSLGTPNANTLLNAQAGLLLGTRSGLFRWEPARHSWTKLVLQHPRGGDSPPGGVTRLLANPSDPLVVYAGSAGSGLYRSQDGGLSWAKVSSNLEVGVRDLAMGATDGANLYMAAAWERAYYSRDSGQSWQAQWTGLDLSTEANSLAIDPLHPATLYLGTEAGLYRSRYAGEDWQPVGRALDDQTILTLQARASIQAEPAQGAYANSRGQARAAGLISNSPPATTVLYIGATRGAYRSFDGGQSVEPWGHGLEETSVTAFLFDAENSQHVVAGTAYAGVYQSLDGGQTWQPVGPAGLANDVVNAMAWGPGGELFVASAGGVWVGTR